MNRARLVLVTDAAMAADEVVARVADALAGGPVGAVAVQLRRPGSAGREVAALAERLAASCAARGASLVVNDRLDVAVAVGAAGVHLGGRSVAIGDARALLGEGAVVSVAAHSDADVEAAARMGATAALVSPVYASPGKGEARGVEALRRARSLASGLRLFALGGVEVANAGACRRAGADGVAVIRAVFGARDCGAAVAALLAALEA